MSGLRAYKGAAPANNTDALVVRHAELVKRIAYHLAGRLPASVEVSDLIQAGMLGLLEAASNYTADRGASFETYAGIRIRGAMLDALRKLDWAPRSVHRKARAAAAAVRELEAEFGREARDVEIAEKMGVSLDEYHRIAQDAASCRVASLDDSSGDEESLLGRVEDEGADPFLDATEEGFRSALAGADQGAARARAAGDVDVLRRRAESERDRRGAEGDGIAGVPAAWTGTGAVEGSTGRLARPGRDLEEKKCEQRYEVPGGRRLLDHASNH